MSSFAAVDQAYSSLVYEVKSCAENCFPLKKFKRFLKPYWNKELRDLHHKMKTKRGVWTGAGKPRNPTCRSYIEYKDAKRNFRRCHRHYVEKYLQSQNEEIDRAAEIDSNMFWRMVNARRKASANRAGSEIIFNGKHFNTSAEITTEWGKYFKDLYSPTNNDYFDNSFDTLVSSEMNQIDRVLSDSANPLEYPEISVDEVGSAVKLAHKNKAGGEDGITYEHVIYGGEFLFEIIAKFFNAVIRYSYAPKEMKKGVIVTLFKGGNKRKDNPDNDRAITFSSVILKLLGRILLTRVELFNVLNPPLHPLQGGFRKNLGCQMTSFLLKECISFGKENGSKVYVCFLDVQKAFDHVWHRGLFYKLYHAGIDKAIIKVVMNLYSDMESCVKGHSSKSDWFSISQGTRQGGVISPLLYLIFINDLLYELEASGFGIGLHDINCCSPTVADDMVLVSYSKYGMDQLLNICFEYSIKWKYRYNNRKCSVVVYNESKSEYQRSSRKWMLGHNSVDESTKYKHLGFCCDKYLSLDENIKDASNKIKGTLLNLINCGIYEGGFNPITSHHLYITVVLPKAIYGCKLWNNLLPKHISLLETSHRFSIKYMQSLPKRTSTDIALSLLSCKSIEYEIDYRKLIFFGQLCCLPNDYRVKEVFLRRLFNFNTSVKLKCGFIPDIYRILGNYSLIDAFDKYVNTGVFASKFLWKRLVREKIRMAHESEWRSRVENSVSLNRFLNIHEHNKVYILWEFSKRYPKNARFVQNAVCMLARMFSGKWSQNCKLCTETTLSQTEHLILFCNRTNEYRDIFWKKLILRFGLEYFMLLISYSPDCQLEMLFSGCRGVLSDEVEILDCLKIFVNYLAKIQFNSDFAVMVKLPTSAY